MSKIPEDLTYFVHFSNRLGKYIEDAKGMSHDRYYESELILGDLLAKLTYLEMDSRVILSKILPQTTESMPIMDGQPINISPIVGTESKSSNSDVESMYR